MGKRNARRNDVMSGVLAADVNTSNVALLDFLPSWIGSDSF